MTKNEIKIFSRAEKTLQRHATGLPSLIVYNIGTYWIPVGIPRAMWQ